MNKIDQLAHHAIAAWAHLNNLGVTEAKRRIAACKYAQHEVYLLAAAGAATLAADEIVKREQAQ